MPRKLANPSLRLDHLEINRRLREVILASNREDVVAKTRALRWILDSAYFRLSPHRDPLGLARIEGVDPVDQIMFGASFNQRTLRSALGRDKYRQVMSVFFRSVDHVGHAEGLTKAYVLRQDVVEWLDAEWAGNSEVEVYDHNSGRRVDRSMLPVNGIIRSSYVSTNIPAFIDLDLNDLHHRINELDAQLRAGVKLHQVRKATIGLRWLRQVRQWTRLLGGIPNYYADYSVGDRPDSGSGRLFGIGPCHPQRLVKAARSVIYRDRGWFDYDWTAAHPNMLVALAGSVGVEMPFLEAHLLDRDEIAERLAEDLDIQSSRIKRLVNSSVYSIPLSSSPRFAMRKMLGSAEALDKLKENLWYLALRQDVREAIGPVLRDAISGNRIINAVKKSRTIKPRGKRKTPRNKLLSHLLTGLEAWTLREVIENREGIQVLAHDGFVCSMRLNTAEIENHIRDKSREKLGFELNLKLKETPL